MAWALAFVLAFAFTACGGNADGAADSSSNDAATKESSAEQTNEQASTELKGKPWVTSIITGNLPSEQPEAKDDFFTHYNYDFLAERQASMATSAMQEHAQELNATCLEIGKMGKDIAKNTFTMDEMCAMYPSCRMQHTLEKLGKGSSPRYIVNEDWIKTLNNLWTAYNLDDLKLRTHLGADKPRASESTFGVPRHKGRNGDIPRRGVSPLLGTSPFPANHNQSRSSPSPGQSPTIAQVRYFLRPYKTKQSAAMPTIKIA